MKKHILKSMTDFVLERENMVKQTYEDMSRDLCILAQYAYFLKQPLKLGMFVPCGEDGKPLEEPFKLEYSDELCRYCSLERKGCYGTDGGYMAGCEGSRCEETLEDYHVLYQEAKERVLFKGVELVEKREVYDSIKGILIDLESQTFQIEGSLGVGGGYLIDETIEYLTSLELELTQSAAKQFYN